MTVPNWGLTFEKWARRVDALVIERAPVQIYALDGRTPEREFRHEIVPPEFFASPCWRSPSGFVVLYDQGDDRQTRASYMPTANEPLRQGQPTPIAPPNVFYDRDERGAEEAASDIVAFLQQKAIPTRKRGP